MDTQHSEPVNGALTVPAAVVEPAPAVAGASREYKVKLTVHQAAALRAAAQRMQGLQGIINAYSDADRLMTDTIVRDAGFEPEEFEPTARLAAQGGDQYLILTTKVG